MNYTIYDPTIGEILYTLTLSIANANDPNLQGKSYIEGNYSSKKYYIENGQPVEKPTNPSDNVKYYDFDYVSKSYILNTEQTAVQSRVYRNRLLSAVDKINPIWYNSLSREQQQELADYRTALLDVPQQSDFPKDIVWPTKPTWI